MFLFIDVFQEFRKLIEETSTIRWLKKLQQYEFEIIHRKGQTHQITERLSKRLCERHDCGYCTEV